MQLQLNNLIEHDYCLYGCMHDFTKIETPVLLMMVTAHSSYYGRELTPGESKDCQKTISQLQEEIASRKYSLTKHAVIQGD